MSSISLKFYVYWEKQKPGESTCGIHALNAILQAPSVDYNELYSIALDQEQLERQFLLSAGMTEEDYKLMNGHQNSYEFDISVLEKALDRRSYTSERCTLKTLYNLRIDDEKIAYLCNIYGHWLSIRHIHNGRWFILDSTREDLVELNGKGLCNYLNKLLSSNQSVFLIKRRSFEELPSYKSNGEELLEHQRIIILE